jgi:hypothetical protein
MSDWTQEIAKRTANKADRVGGGVWWYVHDGEEGLDRTRGRTTDHTPSPKRQKEKERRRGRRSVRGDSLLYCRTTTGKPTKRMNRL